MDIRHLEEDRLSKNLLSIEKTNLDTNGNVLNKEEIVVKHFVKRDEFIQFFVENINFINTELSNIERQILFATITRMNYGNVVTIYSGLRKEFMALTGLSKASVSRAIQGLIEKKVLLPLNTPELQEKYMVFNQDSFLVNPNIVGKGSFRELKRLRQMVITDFDFEKLEVKQEIIKETYYCDYQELINKNEYKVDSIVKSNDNNTCQTEIRVVKHNEELGLNDTIIDLDNEKQ
ncbi:hypothetical protein AVBRAN12640_07930 [Campylobacter sp. RM12640]|uniref:hypothetical protein n=1 Tax=unclassified Campylobacter TaxID=2593542 RepID=UPI001D7DA5A2|nr:hypothetical protein [Campylobacter sp. RM12642]MBZ7982463.1 hypothetical protein [Campylobacter sp. RM12640]MBZ7989968.1 hypothetical protein [Campylobacter sp. RM12635]MBZ8008219.1 hypothetical protein [Campylobacter sp. RM9334]